MAKAMAKKKTKGEREGTNRVISWSQGRRFISRRVESGRDRVSSSHPRFSREDSAGHRARGLPSSLISHLPTSSAFRRGPQLRTRQANPVEEDEGNKKTGEYESETVLSRAELAEKAIAKKKKRQRMRAAKKQKRLSRKVNGSWAVPRQDQVRATRRAYNLESCFCLRALRYRRDSRASIAR